MRTGNPSPDVGMIISDASISAYRIVQGDTTDTTNANTVVKAATAATQVPIGITQQASDAADQYKTVRISGISMCEVDGSGTAIDNGTPIIATTGGVGIAATSSGSSVQWVIGFAQAPSSASGDIIPVLIDRTYYPVGA